jgi:VanZ family protein
LVEASISMIRPQRVLFWRIALGGAVLGFTVLALLPVERLPPLSVFNWWDKAQHALAFAVLAVLARLGWPRVPAWRWCLALVVYGVLIELAQAATGWRHGSVADALADAVGVVAGLGVAALWGRRGVA